MVPLGKNDLYIVEWLIRGSAHARGSVKLDLPNDYSSNLHHERLSCQINDSLNTVEQHTLA